MKKAKLLLLKNKTTKNQPFNKIHSEQESFSIFRQEAKGKDGDSKSYVKGYN